ncbi:hypothetical protein CDIK_1310 [Cucumispora dikerogammari]|nr:hypothetical protein CDIK_1310 [Cucumispora dikerogammari]
MFRVYKKIQEKRQKQNPVPIYRKIKTLKIIKKPFSNFDSLIYKLNTKTGINTILSKQFKETELFPAEFQKLINILFKMWIEKSRNSVFKALKKLLKFQAMHLIKDDIFRLFKLTIQFKKMTDEFYEIFFSVCKDEILENKMELRQIVHFDYLTRLF